MNDVIVDGDLVVVRWTENGTQQGRFGNLEPTGKNVTWTGINIFRVECGQVVESWNATDGIGLQQQLGADLRGTPAAAAPAAQHEVQRARFPRCQGWDRTGRAVSVWVKNGNTFLAEQQDDRDERRSATDY